MPELPDLPGDDDPQARSGSWIPVAAIAVVAAVHTVLLHGRNYVQNDDIFQFTAAQKWGLSWDLLRLNVFNHFGPINRASHWAVLQLSPLNPDAALAASVAYLVAALASLNWLMAVLGASARRRAAIVVLLGSSLPLFMTTTWLDSAVHTYGALAATCLVLGCGVRAVERRSTAWRAATVGCLALGFLVQVRAAFAAPLLVVLLALVVWRDVPVRRRWQHSRGHRLFLALLVVAAAVGAFTEQRYYATDALTGRPSASVVPELVAKGIGGYLVPAAVGRPITRAGPEVVAMTALAMAAGVALLLRRERSNGGPLVFALVAALLHLVLLWFGVTISVGADHLATRLDYMVYILVPAAIAASTIRWRRRDGGEGRPPGSAARALLRPAGIAVLGVGAVVTYNVSQYFDETYYFGGVAPYYDAVRASADLWSSDEVTVLPVEGPAGFGPSWADAYYKQESWLPMISGRPLRLDLGDRPVVIDSTGQVRDVVLEQLAVSTAPRACAGGAHRQVRVGLPTLVGTNRARFAVVGYRASTANPAVSVVTSDGDDAAATYNLATYDLAEGERRVVLPLHSAAGFDEVALQLAEPGDLCITDLAVVSPVLPVDGACQELDRYGIAGAPRPCVAGPRASPAG